MRYLRLLYVFFRVGVLGELADRVNFFVRLFRSFLGLGTALVGLVIIFQSMYEAGRWPVSLYPAWLRIASRLFWRSGIRYDSGAFA